MESSKEGRALGGACDSVEEKFMFKRGQYKNQLAEEVFKTDPKYVEKYYKKNKATGKDLKDINNLLTFSEK